jgi:hypothetical protein
MKAFQTWISDWRHALTALAFGALALVAAIWVPDHRWAKLGELLERIAEDPAGAAVMVSLLAGAVTTLRGAWLRQPPGGPPASGAAGAGPGKRPTAIVDNDLDRRIVPVALVLVACLGASGCGASALRQHATIASVSSAALAAAAPLVPAACDAALTACHGSEGCVTPTADRCRIAAASVEVAVASVRGYADAIEVASLADEGEVMPALLSALGGVTRLWAELVAALASLDVELPALPALASALLGGAS